MAINEALDHVNVHSEDTFKVTSDNWLGNLDYANRVQTSSTPQRFYASSYKFKTVIIGNCNATNNAYIGKYYSNATTFVNNALVIWAKTNITFEFVDIYDLAYRSYTAAQYLQIIGINEY